MQLRPWAPTVTTPAFFTARGKQPVNTRILKSVHRVRITLASLSGYRPIWLRARRFNCPQGPIPEKLDSVWLRSRAQDAWKITRVHPREYPVGIRDGVAVAVIPPYRPVVKVDDIDSNVELRDLGESAPRL